MTWPTKKLGEIADCTDGDWILSRDLKTGREVRLIQLGDVGESVFLDKTDKWISKKRCKELKCTILKSGDILLARLGDPLAKSCIFPGFNYPCITAVDVTIIRTKAMEESRFLLRYLNFQSFKKQVYAFASGATRKRISRKNLEELEIPLLPLSEQKRIVEKIEKVFAKIDKAQKLRESALADSATLLPSTLHHIFSGTKWPTVNINDVCELRTGGTPRKGIKEYYSGGNIKWLVSGDIHKREIYDCKGRITKKGMEKSNAKILPINTVLIALNGQGKTRGTVAMLKTEATCSQSLIGMIPKDNSKFLPEFLFSYLSGQYLYIRALTGMNDRRGLNMKLVGDINIPLPPVAEQKRIVSYLEVVSEKARRLQELQKSQLADFSALRQSALHQAFQGKL